MLNHQTTNEELTAHVDSIIALEEEIKDRSVPVTYLLPGATTTGFHNKEKIL